MYNGCSGRLHQQQQQASTRAVASCSLPVETRRTKTDVADVTRDRISLIVAFVNDFHILPGRNRCLGPTAILLRRRAPLRDLTAARRATQLIATFRLIVTTSTH